jgi:hypothetical protein
MALLENVPYGSVDHGKPVEMPMKPHLHLIGSRNENRLVSGRLDG